MCRVLLYAGSVTQPCATAVVMPLAIVHEQLRALATCAGPKRWARAYATRRATQLAAEVAARTARLGTEAVWLCAGAVFVPSVLGRGGAGAANNNARTICSNANSGNCN